MGAADWQRAPTVREALLWEPLAGGAVACRLCERGCVIAPGRLGTCATRLNYGGRLLTLAYGDLAALESRPIEIKPFFHYWPGSTALTYTTWSCNLACAWCQNHGLSRRRPDPRRAQFFPPPDLVALARAGGDQGLCVSFTEPTLLFEHCCDTFPVARSEGLYCCFVSNGRMTAEALAMLAARGLDGLKVDVKGPPEVYRRFCGAEDGIVPWDRIHQAKGRYFPAHRFKAPATPVRVLEQACRMARDAGVDFAYLGNVAGHPWEDTRCPGCGTLLLQRYGAALVQSAVTPRGTCSCCERPLPLRGQVGAGHATG